MIKGLEIGLCVGVPLLAAVVGYGWIDRLAVGSDIQCLKTEQASSEREFVQRVQDNEQDKAALAADLNRRFAEMSKQMTADKSEIQADIREVRDMIMRKSVAASIP